MCNRLHLYGNRLPMTVFEKLISKSHNSSSDMFLKILSKGHNFSKWLVLKEIAKSHKLWLSSSKDYKYVTMAWIWNQSIIFIDWSYSFLSINLSIFSFISFNRFFLVSFLFIFLKVFVQNILFQEKFFVQKLVLFIFSFSSPYAKKNSPRTNRLNSFCVSLLPFPKERRTKRLNSFVSPFSLVKEFKTTQSENSFDSSLSHKQKISKD